MKVIDFHIHPNMEKARFRPSLYELCSNASPELKDFFIDLKVPRLKRDRIPVLFNKDKIVWVVGYRIDERFKVDKTTKKILNIKALFYDA